MAMKNSNPNLKLLKLVCVTLLLGVVLYAAYDTIIGVYVLIVFIALLLISCLMVFGFGRKLSGGF